MSLHTFEVNWKHTDGQVKYVRLFTSTAEYAEAYLRKEYPDTFVKIVSIKQEPDKTTYCNCCHQKISSNFIKEMSHDIS